MEDPSCTYHRFDRLQDLVAFCKRTFRTLDVVATNEGSELVVRVRLPDGTLFTRLVAHFEGERAYVIGLPKDGLVR